MSIDYEAEYNSRARVPEHPQVFERWNREAAAYRDETSHAGRAELGILYGDSVRQTIDLFKPASDSGLLAMFIHGGYWRSLEPSQFSHMARGLNAHGVAVAVAGYDLCPQVSIARIIEQIRRASELLWQRFQKRLMVYGHSAGGHLAACMLGTDWRARETGVPANLVPAACAISGVFDLMPLLHLETNADFKLDEAEAKRISPSLWPAPVGRVLDAVVGGDESSEFLRQSRVIVDAWKGQAETRYEAIPGANHFTATDPLSDPGSAMVKRLLALGERTRD